MPMQLPPSTQWDPIGDTLVVEMYRQIGAWKPNSKILIPDTAREEIFFGKVLHTGPGRVIDIDAEGQSVRKNMEISPGDWIIYARYKGERVQVGERFFLVLRADDILSRIHMGEDMSEFIKPLVLGEEGTEEILKALDAAQTH